jgi:hypothetical protein
MPQNRYSSTMQDSSDDALQYIATGAAARAYAVGGSIYGLPDRPDAPEVAEVDRPASSLTGPNKRDVDVKLAQCIKASGLLGTAVLTRTYTANGRPTRGVPVHLAGMQPTERVPFVELVEDATLTNADMYMCRRYRAASKGAKFAASMEKEARVRARNWWRAARPYWPLNADGSFESGIVRVNPNTGRETLKFKDGSYLDARIAAWKHTDKDESEAIEAKRARELSRAEELKLLADEQAADAQAQKRGRLLETRKAAKR